MPDTPPGTIVVLPDGRPVLRTNTPCECCNRCWCWCNGAVLPTTFHARLICTFAPPWVCGECGELPYADPGDCTVFDMDVSYDVTSIAPVVGSPIRTSCLSYSGPSKEALPIAHRTGPVCVSYYYGDSSQLLCTRIRNLEFMMLNDIFFSWGSGLTFLCDHYTSDGSYKVGTDPPTPDWFVEQPNGAWVIKRDLPLTPPDDCDPLPEGEVITSIDYLACCGGDPTLPNLGDSPYLKWVCDLQPHTWSCGDGHFSAQFHVRNGLGTIIGSLTLSD